MLGYHAVCRWLQRIRGNHDQPLKRSEEATSVLAGGLHPEFFIALVAFPEVKLPLHLLLDGVGHSHATIRRQIM